MKTTSLLTSVLCLTFQFGICQIITPKAGVAFSIITTDENGVTTSLRTGFTAGCAFSFDLSDKFVLQPELSFVQKGAKATQEVFFEYSTGGVDYRVESDSKSNALINYVELPVLVKFQMPSKLFIAAGPSIAVGMGGSYETHFNYTQYENELVLEKFSKDGDGDVIFDQTPDIYPPFGYHEDLYINQRIDFGLQVAAGIAFPKLVLDLRYCHGFTTLWEGSQNRAIYFTIGIPFELKN